MISHFANQSQTCQLLIIKMLNDPAWHHRMAISATPCGVFVPHGKDFVLKTKIVFSIERKLLKVVQSQVELMRVKFSFETPILQVQIITNIIRSVYDRNVNIFSQYVTQDKVM